MVAPVSLLTTILSQTCGPMHDFLVCLPTCMPGTRIKGLSAVSGMEKFTAAQAWAQAAMVGKGQVQDGISAVCIETC